MAKTTNTNVADTGGKKKKTLVATSEREARKQNRPNDVLKGSRKVQYSKDKTDRSSSIYRRGEGIADRPDLGGAVGHEGNNAIPNPYYEHFNDNSLYNWDEWDFTRSDIETAGRNKGKTKLSPKKKGR